jgi:hypothetical protein
MDWWTKLEGGESLHLRPSHDQVAGRFIVVTVRGRRVGRSTRQCCRGVERIRVSRRAATFFPLAASYRFCGD